MLFCLMMGMRSVHSRGNEFVVVEDYVVGVIDFRFEPDLREPRRAPIAIDKQLWLGLCNDESVVG